ncbi:MAG: response regulator transcription factor [Ferruginibacter sp.]|nr:response regulator transcription factor [Ferruginibacter sp.]
MKHSIAIVDDHILIAKALSGIIENFKDFEVLYECENGKALQEKFSNKKNIPDIVLLDISMPVMDGFETAQWLRQSHPQVLIMALSMQDDEQSLIKMIKSGAKGYLLKNVHPLELEKALINLVKNGSYYPDWATSKVFTSLGSASNAQTETINITEREKEFLQYSVTEMSYKEIAEKMFCSPRTVESYRDALFEKLGLKTRVGLAVYAMKNGFG